MKLILGNQLTDAEKERRRIAIIIEWQCSICRKTDDIPTTLPKCFKCNDDNTICTNAKTIF